MSTVPDHLVLLDYAASTPMRPEAIEAQRVYDASPIAGANPNSLHTLGRQAAQELERCRRVIAKTLGGRVRPSEVIFTGGGTESDQLALLGISEGVRARDRKRTRVITSSIEHDAILDNLPLLREAGFSVTVVDPDRDGTVRSERLADALDTDVALVSIMVANNETGVVQPTQELATLAHGVGAFFHADAIQGYLHMPIDVCSLGIDALSVAGHKIGGPVASGFLYLKGRTPLRPRVFGGGQEAGRRAGTQDLRGIVALAAAADTLAKRLPKDHARLMELSASLYRTLCAHPKIHPTVPDILSQDRLPGIVSIYVDGWDSETLVLRLDAAGFEVSAGSACSSGSTAASHVLTAMGMDAAAAQGSLRISFDDRVRSDDLDAFADALAKLIG
ncbi:cysteine desulfurase family protein [Collinsella sp. An2]|uniref:cysteine desulfurase family protein n=1 Tax=Collinsella sp. An2 TaxID=1965585 RepID=UPI0031B864B5